MLIEEGTFGTLEDNKADQKGIKADYAKRAAQPKFIQQALVGFPILLSIQVLGHVSQLEFNLKTKKYKGSASLFHMFISYYLLTCTTIWNVSAFLLLMGSGKG